MPRLTRRRAGLLWLCHLASAWSCADQEKRESVQIRAAALVGMESAQCGRLYSRWGKTFGVADARFYLSDIELFRRDSSTWESLELVESQWQSKGVALLDFEDAQGSCADFGTASLNTQLIGEVPEGDYVGLRFKVGLPADQNHIDPATVRGPLAEPGMFWTWQGGYKFAKVDVNVVVAPGQAPIRSNLHLGSTGCTSPAPMIAPAQGCTRPNLAQVTLFPFDPNSQRLELALDTLLMPALAQGEARSPNCMGGLSEPAFCETVVRSFGLDPQTGRCEQDCSAQSLFRVGPQNGAQ